MCCGCVRISVKYVCLWISRLCMLVSKCIKCRLKKTSDKIYHLNISGSVVTLLQMAPTVAGVSGMRNFTRCGMQALECEFVAEASLPFLYRLSGIGDATKSENPLGNKNLQEVSLMMLSSLTRIYE